MTNKLKRIGVVGAGAMGSQIAMVTALSGYSVVLQDITPESLHKSKSFLHEQMAKRIQKGRFTEEEVESAFAKLMFTTELAELKNTDLVIEAIVENLEAKQALFNQLDQLVPKHTILATNSSTIVSSKLIESVSRPEKVCNIHFFNPALVMELVEVVKGPHTSDETAEISMAFVESIGKKGVLLKKEISGFIANRILGKLMDEAVFLYENGYASFEEIDVAVTKALGHPIGPFALMDLTGLDVNYAVRMQRFKESGDENEKPSATVTDKVEKGELGRKTGKGFYDYDATGKRIGITV
ncbi:3-hydroxyacyl-CoA dehydrogenase family protein [Bacillus massiliigorillae]|uniref:3-hydroxyacyl-CoA dehydrogenase family protein n=1 Tax=Bacillus massiliigorillae TaxID=1243664 RepID=UPI0003A91337|nr:3-hydroxyacyl-CoA dehydrogenase family protein [Bacillus massiliigorillae]